MKWLYNNMVKDSTFTVTNEDPYYPFSEAFDDSRLAVFGRTTTHRNVYFDFDLGVQDFISHVGILGHNLSQFATITISANSSSDLNNAIVVYTGTWTEKNIIEMI